MRNIEHNYFKAFRSISDMHEASLEESGGICYAFSHLIHAAQYLFGSPTSLQRDNWHDSLKPVKGTNVRQYEMLKFSHSSGDRDIKGIIELGYGSHRPELTIELDTDSASYRANIFEGTLEIWQGGKLISIETDEATKIQMLRRQMKKFLGVPDYCSDKTI